jgi:hypothetical protein
MLSSQFIKLALQLSSLSADFSFVNAKSYLPDKPVPSKGQATLLTDGLLELPATIRTISTSGIGVVAGALLPLGTTVDVHIHGHTARGTVEDCRPEGDEFYIAIALAA